MPFVAAVDLTKPHPQPRVPLATADLRLPKSHLGDQIAVFVIRSVGLSFRNGQKTREEARSDLGGLRDMRNLGQGRMEDSSGNEGRRMIVGAIGIARLRWWSTRTYGS